MSDGIIKHCNKVANYVTTIYGYYDDLYVACLAHDIGKVKVSDNILNKRDSLTEVEFDEVKKHPIEGAKILKKLGYNEQIVKAVSYHHERWDGNGYPSGVIGDNIPIFSRIIAVADAYDAMTSNRAYRRALLPEHAIEELKVNAGKQFDPCVVETFINGIKEEKLIDCKLRRYRKEIFASVINNINSNQNILKCY